MPIKTVCTFCRSKKLHCAGSKPCSAHVSRSPRNDCVYTGLYSLTPWCKIRVQSRSRDRHLEPPSRTIYRCQYVLRFSSSRWSCQTTCRFFGCHGANTISEDPATFRCLWCPQAVLAVLQPPAALELHSEQAIKPVTPTATAAARTPATTPTVHPRHCTTPSGRLRLFRSVTTARPIRSGTPRR